MEGEGPTEVENDVSQPWPPFVSDRVVDLFLFNLLTPHITLYPSRFLSLPFSRVRSTLGSRGSRVKNRCRKNRGGGLVVGEKDRLGKRAASNRKRRKGREDKLRFARKADYMCRRFVFADRFQSICG